MVKRMEDNCNDDNKTYRPIRTWWEHAHKYDKEDQLRIKKVIRKILDKSSSSADFETVVREACCIGHFLVINKERDFSPQKMTKREITTTYKALQKATKLLEKITEETAEQIKVHMQSECCGKHEAEQNLNKLAYMTNIEGRPFETGYVFKAIQEACNLNGLLTHVFQAAQNMPQANRPINEVHRMAVYRCYNLYKKVTGLEPKEGLFVNFAESIIRPVFRSSKQSIREHLQNIKKLYREDKT